MHCIWFKCQHQPIWNIVKASTEVLNSLFNPVQPALLTLKFTKSVIMVIESSKDKADLKDKVLLENTVLSLL
jgi:hypothetical protein